MVPYYDGMMAGFRDGWNEARYEIEAVMDELRTAAGDCATAAQLADHRTVGLIHELVWRRLVDRKSAAAEAYKATLPEGIPVNNSRLPILGQPPGYASAT